MLTLEDISNFHQLRQQRKRAGDGNWEGKTIKIRVEKNEDDHDDNNDDDNGWSDPEAERALLVALCVIFMILVLLEIVEKCALGGCTITSKAKINVIWKNFEGSGPQGAIRVKKFEVIMWPHN